jgi:hypothetical protein
MNKLYFDLRSVCLLIFLMCASPLLMAQQKEMVSFVLSMEQPAEHKYYVEMSYNGATGEIVDLKMPMWTPGYYGILDFPKNVRNFHAVDGAGKQLAWEKTKENCWRVCAHHSSQISVVGVMKSIFGRYRGLAKNLHCLQVPVARMSLYMIKRALLRS